MKFVAFRGKPAERTREIRDDIARWIIKNVRLEPPSGKTVIISVPGHKRKHNDRQKMDRPTLAHYLSGRFQAYVSEELIYAFCDYVGLSDHRDGHNTNPNVDNDPNMERRQQVIAVPGFLK